jgi:UDP-N-acetylglucosamine:LPS N-acetylglucosamine transferase
MTRPHIALATIAAGGGHVATARAMAQAIAAAYPDQFDLTISDLMSDLGFTAQDHRHKAQWRWMLAHPWTARSGQQLIDAFPSVTRRVLRRSLDEVAKAAAQHFQAQPPALIVANHGFLTFALTRSRRRYGLSTPVLTFATEPLDASALWAEPEADHFAVPSRPALNDLVRLGVSADKIDVVGYPVQQTFLRPPSQGEARARLGLPERFTCLVSLGGEGIGTNAVAVVRTLLALPQTPQVVVITGRNEALAAELRAFASPLLAVRGFIDNMADYLAACDLVIGKAGPASVMEALAVGRPLLVTGYAGLNEVKLLRFLVTRGLGHEVRDLAGLFALVGGYQASPHRLAAVADGCRQLDLAGMTARLASYLQQAATHGFPAERSRQGGLV